MVTDEAVEAEYDAKGVVETTPSGVGFIPTKAKKTLFGAPGQVNTTPAMSESSALPPIPYLQYEREVTALVDERDAFSAAADKLATALAPEEVLGEHSSTNDPWQNALDYAGSKQGGDVMFSAERIALLTIELEHFRTSEEPPRVFAHRIIAALREGA